MHVKTAVGQVSMKGGDWREVSANVLVEEPASRLGRGRDRGNLYVLAQVSGPAPGREALARELIAVVRHHYYRWRGSITAGLQEAIRQANSLLFEENRNSLPGERRSAGMSCLVLRDRDLFVAQAGPTAAFLGYDDQVTRFPDISPWLDDVSLEEMDVAPIGDKREVHIDLFHADLQQEGSILLINSELAGRVSPEAWPTILDHDSPASILEAVVAAGQGQDLSALVVVLGREGSPAGQPAAGQSVRQPLAPQLPKIEAGAHLRRLGRGLGAALRGLWHVILTLVGRMVPTQFNAQQATRRESNSVKKAGKRSRQRRTGGERQQIVQRLLIATAVAIPLIVAIVVIVVVVQRGRAQRAELEALWQNANLKWEQAQTANDPAVVRTSLTKAQDSLEQYLVHQPQDTEAIELEKTIRARLDEINQVRRVNWVGELNSYPPTAALTRVVVEGVHVFVMDRNAGTVYHHQLDDFQQALQPDTRETVLVSKGQQVGDVLVADLVDMVWVPVGEGRQKANLVILESGGNLLEYDPATGELRPLRVAASETWQFPELVGSYYGRFYVLDPTANKIWRYQPTSDGYSSPPDDWLQAEVDLIGTEDLAIGNSIYLLYADGQIRKLTAGRPDTFDISDWDTPPSNPSALFTRPPEETQWVYLADRGHSRIVQCSKEGKLQRQFRLAEADTDTDGDILGGVTSLFVDEIGGNAFFLSRQKLYMIVLPE